MRVAVDQKRCVSSAICMGIAPDVFEIADDGLLRMLAEDVPPDQEADVRDAVHSCPTGALTLAG